MGGCNNGATIRKVVMEVKLMVFSLVETKHSSVSSRLISKWWGGDECLRKGERGV